MGKLVEWIGNVLFPKRCVLCEGILNLADADICPECRLAEMVIVNNGWKIPHVKSWIPLWRYAGDVRSSLIRYKFHHKRSYSITYGRELADKLKGQDISFDLITWVPISWQRKSTRGYDQVKLLADEVGRRLNKPVICCLKKKKHNKKQALLRTKAARSKNVSGVYKICNTQTVAGKRVLLLDDIVTTGTTVSEAARVLKDAGAKCVFVGCIAASSGTMR